MGLLGYSRWKNFLEAIKRAENACFLQKIELSYHFRDVTKMVDSGLPTSFYTANSLCVLSALASLGLVASLWVAPTLKGRLRASA